MIQPVKATLALLDLIDRLTLELAVGPIVRPGTRLAPLERPAITGGKIRVELVPRLFLVTSPALIKNQCGAGILLRTQ